MNASQKSLLIRADASMQIGAGHVMRSLALAKAWQSSGGNVTFAMASTIPGIQERFSDENIELRYLNSEIGSEQDADETLRLSQATGAMWTVIDGYQFSADYIHRWQDSESLSLLFDDDGRLPAYYSNVILNQNVGANEKMYHHRERYTRLLLGAEYALLRPEFLAGQRSHDIPVAARRLLVCMGGSDPDNVTRSVLDALAGMRDKLETTVVVGSGSPNYADLNALAMTLPGVRLELNPRNMASLIRQADIAFSAAGSTCWELAYFGVPMMLTILASNQEGNAQALSSCGAAINLGWHCDLTPSKIAESIEHLAADPLQRRRMSEHAQELVDGRGAERVVNFLRSFS